ncbi:MAG: AAA family ATPase [Porcincola intestinalis]|uniref:SF1B family DNA helicase RecD2 n=1 Tax=Porcincola intestinalis TaxID=2606632 RepID=UPI0029D49B86|nr:AAA family ATPase [Porcincola intestinalis]MCI6238303.1 AAA family ATPase [Lachnospiraceae bacterium]MCI7093938.1 AAA family ATPase [Lachnospiraceae bacterium]MDY5333014.1 AAA family ATPase [Porcincola intestinalis]
MSDTTIKGFVEHITYRSEETGYTVLTLCADGEEVTAVGVLPEIGEGETIQCEGTFQVHATYGRQFRIREFSLSVPEDEASMERYLSSGLIKGIGKALAHRIVKRFGTETFDIIEKEPDRLAEVNGISEKKAREIYLQVCEKKDQRDGVLFLSRYGISNTLALRIWKAYGSEVYRIIRENPYRLADELRGVGFHMADEIARKAGMAVDSRFRVGSGILYTLQLAAGEGSLYLPKAVLLRRASSLLSMPIPSQLPETSVQHGLPSAFIQPGISQASVHPGLPQVSMQSALLEEDIQPGAVCQPVTNSAEAAGQFAFRDVEAAGTAGEKEEDVRDPDSLSDEDFFAGLYPERAPGREEIREEEEHLELLEDCLRNLSADRKVIIRKEEGEERIYEPRAYYTELRTAKMLHDLNITYKGTEADSRKRATEAARKTKTELDERQLEAVIRADSCGVLILTGGPGTGKTTTINTMIAMFEAEGLKIALAAPTGRAAKRMTEATGHDASTVHRLLEVSGDPEKGTVAFGKNDEEPLEQDVVIIDEMSMVDIYLMASLLKAVPVGTHLVLVGDASQLPSVGPGSVLRDMIHSKVLPTVTLTTVFRQAQESDIVMNAHRINKGEHPVIDNKSRDFFFLKRQRAEDIIGQAIHLVRDSLPKYVQADTADIQVMTPMKKGLVGTIRLNAVMQQALNPAGPRKREWARGDVVFREGDRVMQVRNNYQKEWTIRGRYGAVIDTGAGIYNGDMGVIRAIDPLTDLMTVEFDEHRCVDYEKSELDQLELSYAVTIHKAQGSEYPAVIIPMLRGPRMLMNRNLIYTAITRARKCVVLIGDPAVLDDMIDNTMQEKRYTTLALRLQECEEQKHQQEEDENPFAWMDEPEADDAL